MDFFLFSIYGLDTHGWLSCKLDEYIGNVHKWRPTIFDPPYLPCPTIFTLWHPIFGVILEPLPTLMLDIIDGRSLPIFIFCYFVHYENFLKPVCQKDVLLKILTFHLLFNNQKSQHSSSSMQTCSVIGWKGRKNFYRTGKVRSTFILSNRKHFLQAFYATQ